MTDAPDWAAVRADYEGGRGTLLDIEARYGLNRAQLNHARRSEGWTPRRPKACRTKRGTVMSRLMVVLDRMVLAMETDVSAGKDVDAAQMRLLETMVKTLERLNAMQKDNKAAKPGATRKRSAAEEAALRARLADRIAALGRD